MSLFSQSVYTSVCLYSSLFFFLSVCTSLCLHSLCFSFLLSPLFVQLSSFLTLYVSIISLFSMIFSSLSLDPSLLLFFVRCLSPLSSLYYFLSPFSLSPYSPLSISFILSVSFTICLFLYLLFVLFPSNFNPYVSPSRCPCFLAGSSLSPLPPLFYSNSLSSFRLYSLPASTVSPLL